MVKKDQDLKKHEIGVLGPMNIHLGKVVKCSGTEELGNSYFPEGAASGTKC